MAENEQDTIASPSTPVVAAAPERTAAAATEPPSPDLLDGAELLCAPVGAAAAAEPAAATAAATEFLSEEGMSELREHAPEPGDIVNGMADRDKIAFHLQILLYMGREFRNIRRKKAFVMFFADIWGFHGNIKRTTHLVCGRQVSSQNDFWRWNHDQGTASFTRHQGNMPLILGPLPLEERMGRMLLRAVVQ